MAPWAEGRHLEVCRPVSAGTFLGPIDAPRLPLLAWVHLPRALGKFSLLSLHKVSTLCFLAPGGETHHPVWRERCHPIPIKKEHPWHWGEAGLLSPPFFLHPHFRTCLLQVGLSVHRCGNVRHRKQPEQKASKSEAATGPLVQDASWLLQLLP